MMSHKGELIATRTQASMSSTEETPNEVEAGADPEGAAADEAAAPPSTPGHGPSQVSRDGSALLGPCPSCVCMNSQ
eukprot:5723838-Prymnesium_polylepis.2